MGCYGSHSDLCLLWICGTDGSLGLGIGHLRPVAMGKPIRTLLLAHMALSECKAGNRLFIVACISSIHGTSSVHGLPLVRLDQLQQPV
jgi:hypothetical protein